VKGSLVRIALLQKNLDRQDSELHVLLQRNLADRGPLFPLSNT
jgi:hypothetical protein